MKRHSAWIAAVLVLAGCRTEGASSPGAWTDPEARRERFATMRECVSFAERYVVFECRRYELGFLKETREYVSGEWVRLWAGTGTAPKP